MNRGGVLLGVLRILEREQRVHPVIVLVRFSVFQRDGAGFKRKRTMDADAYKSYLLDEDRLHQKLDIFETLTVPSIQSQTVDLDPDWFRFVVIASQDKPKSVRDRLSALADQVPGMAIEYVPEDCRLIPHKEYIDGFLRGRSTGTQRHASVRLDDDDGLAPNYMARLQEYLDRDTKGFAISFPLGYEALIESGKITALREKYFPKIALGLALIGGSYPKSVYALGQHDKIDRSVPVILDSREPMYLRGIHGDNDTGRWKDDGQVSLVSDHEDALARFPLLRDQL